MGIEITEIRVKLTGDPRNKLRAFCSVTFCHAFVVRDLKIIEGSMGPFIAMPSRKLTDRCVRCTHKNNLRACYCNQCGTRLDPERADRDVRGRARLHADLAHPIHSECRIALHRAIVAAYLEEVEQSKSAGYKPKTFDDFDDADELLDDDYISELLRRKEERDRRTPSPVAEGREDVATAHRADGLGESTAAGPCAVPNCESKERAAPREVARREALGGIDGQRVEGARADGGRIDGRRSGEPLRELGN